MITLYNIAVIVTTLVVAVVFVLAARKDAKKGMNDLRRHNEAKRKYLSSHNHDSPVI